MLNLADAEDHMTFWSGNCRSGRSGNFKTIICQKSLISQNFAFRAL